MVGLCLFDEYELPLDSRGHDHPLQVRKMPHTVVVDLEVKRGQFCPDRRSGLPKHLDRGMGSRHRQDPAEEAVEMVATFGDARLADRCPRIP